MSRSLVSEAQSRPDQIDRVLADGLESLHDPSGVNTQRAENFVRALGGRVPDYAIVHPDQGKEACRLFKAAGVKKKLLPRSHMMTGIQYNELNAAIIYQQIDTYDRLQLEETEQVVVHELMHARVDPVPLVDARPSRWSLFQSGKPDLSAGQFAGCIEGKGGNFHEEVTATLAEAGYVELVYGRNGLDTQTGIPFKYDSIAAPYAYGGMALEALCSKNNELLNALFATRYDSDAPQKVRSIYESISPGLFEYLYTLKNPPHGRGVHPFMKGSEAIMEAIGSTQKDIPAIHAEDVVGSFIKEKLALHQAATGYQFYNAAYRPIIT